MNCQKRPWKVFHRLHYCLLLGGLERVVKEQITCDINRAFQTHGELVGGVVDFSVSRFPFIHPRLEAFQEVLKLGVINVPSLIGEVKINKNEIYVRKLQVVPINNSRARGQFSQP